MQPSSEPHPAAPSRGGSASDANISWHSANTAKTYQALSLFANLRANLGSAHAAPGSSSHGSSHSPATASASAAAATRRSSVPGGHEHTPRTAPRSADNSVQMTRSPSQAQQQPRRRRSSSIQNTHSSTDNFNINSSVSAASTSPTHPTRNDGVSSPSAAPLAFTEAELASMSTGQLRRQLRIASAVTQRLHRRTQQLQREVEAWKAQCGGASPPQQVDQQRDGTTSNGLEKGSDAAGILLAAEQRAAQLQEEVHRLTTEKEALMVQLSQARLQSDGKERAGIASMTQEIETRNEKLASQQSSKRDSPSPAFAPSTTGTHSSDSELVFLRDTVRQLQQRFETSEKHVQQATQLQLDALLCDKTATTTTSTTRASGQQQQQQHVPTVSMVNAEVQKLFQLMQEQLVMNATQQQAERARMNELFYQLERQRGLM